MNDPLLELSSSSDPEKETLVSGPSSPGTSDRRVAAVAYEMAANFAARLRSDLWARGAHGLRVMVRKLPDDAEYTVSFSNQENSSSVEITASDCDELLARLPANLDLLYVMKEALQMPSAASLGEPLA